MAELGRLAVYCGFRDGRDPRYLHAAEALGAEMARRGIELVYGGGGRGMMRRVADACLGSNGVVIGVIPRSLVEREEAHSGLAADAREGSRLEVVSDMHERKARMLELADACAILPGGFGTMDEMFEVLTWRQLALHAKPCGIINTAGYYDSLLEFFGDAREGGFVTERDVDLLSVAEDSAALLDRLEERCAAPPAWVFKGDEG